MEEGKWRREDGGGSLCLQRVLFACLVVRAVLVSPVRLLPVRL